MLSGTCVASCRLHVEIVECRRDVWKFWRNLHDHVVLVELREDGGDLALAEGIVERVVDVGHGDAEARCGVAIDDQVGAETLVLQVAGDIGDGLLLAQFLAPSCACRSRVPPGWDLRASTGTGCG